MKDDIKKYFALAGLLGYSIEGDPRPPLDEMINEINQAEKVVSVDIGSGLDPDTGERKDPCVRPDFTVTLAAPFKGMEKENSGEIWIADISVPYEAFQDSFRKDVFKNDSIVRLEDLR